MALGKAVSGITSPTKIIANVFISFIGAGLLGLPYAFKESGILEGAVIMSIVGYLSVAAMLMLIDCKYAILASGGRSGGRSITMESKVPLIPPDSSEEEDFDRHRGPKGTFSSSDLTYGDIGLYALGSAGKRLVDITIVISQIGFCCGYLIYLCENLKKHLEGLTQGQWLVLLLPPLFGLTLLRHLNKLAIFSLFAQVSNVFALTVVFWFDFSHSEEIPFHAKEVSLKGLPFFFAVSIYCYEGAGMILSLEESVAQQKKRMFKPIFVATMIALTLLYISFGASGYLSFGPHTQQIITLNLPHGNSSIDFAAIVKICLGISFFFTYPMMMFPVTHLLDKTSGFHNDRTKGNMVRLVLVLLTGIIVIAIPSFAVLASLIGATCCTMLAFIMPATFHMSIFKNRLTKRQRYFDMFLIVLGVVGTVIGLWDTVHRISEQPLLVDELAQHHANISLNLSNTTSSSQVIIRNLNHSFIREDEQSAEEKNRVVLVAVPSVIQNWPKDNQNISSSNHSVAKILNYYYSSPTIEVKELGSSSSSRSGNISISTSLPSTPKVKLREPKIRTSSNSSVDTLEKLE